MWTLASCIDRQGALATRDAAGWVVRAAAGLAALHARGEAHGRICADAVQVAGPACSEAGFLASPGDLADEVAYHSPERVRDGKLSPADDTWALGVLLFQCATGKLPFPGTNRQQVAVSILRKPIAALATDAISDAAVRAVVGALLVRDREQRISTVQDLRARIVERIADLGRLRPLGVGEPLEGSPGASGFEPDDDDDDDDDVGAATALFTDDPDILRARMVAAQHGGVDAAAALKDLETGGRGPSEPVPQERPAARGSPLAAIRAQAQQRAEFDIEDPPTVQVEWSKPGAPAEADAAPSHRTEGVFDPDAVFGPPLTAATANWDAVDGGSSRVPAQRPAVETASVQRVGPPPPSGEDFAEERSPAPPGSPARPAPPPPRPLATAQPIAAVAAPLAEPEGEAAEPKRSLLRDLLLVAVLTIVGGVVGFVFLGRMWADDPAASTASAPAAPPAPSEVPAGRTTPAEPTTDTPAGNGSVGSGAVPTLPPSDAAPAASGSPAATDGAAATPATATAGSTAAAAALPRGDVNECVASAFAPGTFATTPPSLDFVCSETDAYKGGVALRVKVIRSGGQARGVTDGMREWAMLGWYEMAAFATIRGVCCTNPPPLSTQPGIDMCPLDEKLEALAKAVVEANDDGMEESLKDFMGMLRCLVAAGVSRTFGQPGPPDPGAVTVFRSTLARARKRAGH